MKKLRVLARGAAMVFDYERHENGVRRFVGRKHDSTLGEMFRDVHGNQLRQGGWPPSHSPVLPDEVPFRAEYVAHVKDKDLWAADAETAAICGVQFDPSFGGEYHLVDEAK